MDEKGDSDGDSYRICHNFTLLASGNIECGFCSVHIHHKNKFI